MQFLMIQFNQFVIGFKWFILKLNHKVFLYNEHFIIFINTISKQHF